VDRQATPAGQFALAGESGLKVSAKTIETYVYFSGVDAMNLDSSYLVINKKSTCKTTRFSIFNNNFY